MNNYHDIKPLIVPERCHAGTHGRARCTADAVAVVRWVTGAGRLQSHSFCDAHMAKWCHEHEVQGELFSKTSSGELADAPPASPEEPISA